MDPALIERLLRMEAPRDPVVEAFVRLRRPGLPVPGVRIVARFGTIATCRLRTSAIAAVHRHPNVVSLKAGRPLGPQYDLPDDLQDIAGQDREVVPLNDRRRARGIRTAGDGVAVGVVDWGLDFDHPNFKNPDGTTRLIALWDQRDERGPSPRPYGYGTLHVRDRIDDALRTGQPYAALGYHPARADRGGGTHGTHVVDIAAGNGRAGGPVGIAPCADLIFVDLADRDTGGLENLGGSVRLCEAVDFCARMAHPRPWVLNLSIGRHGGPHDGTTLTELAFDELLAAAPGRFIVQSAGNYYRAGVHASGVMATGETQSVRFVTDPEDVTDNELEIWYDGDDEFEVRIDPPGAVGPIVSLGRRADLVVGGRRVGRVHHRARDPNNGAHHVDAFLSASAPPGIWTVTLSAIRVRRGRFDAWLERDEGCRRCQTRFVVEDRDPMSTTGTIANGHLPLVVGAYDARRSDCPPASFTSVGPTRDGRDKPDVSAPGVAVLAARSAPASATTSLGALVRKSGSSMATPHVTGAVALCLGLTGTSLSASELRRLVLDTADAADSVRLGFGRLNIGTATAAAARVVGGRVEPSPATVYRRIVYGRHDVEGLGDGVEVLGLPGLPLAQSLRRGDVVITVTLGRRAAGDRDVLAGPALVRRGSDAGVLAGYYATVASTARGGADRRLRRVLDVTGHVPPGTLVIRLSAEGVGG